MRSGGKALLAAALVVAGGGPADADDFPSRPLRVIVPYAAGGPSDTGARLAAQTLGRVLDKPVVVENRGGGGLDATEAYLGIAPDGYTILVGSIGPFTIIPAAKKVATTSPGTSSRSAPPVGRADRGPGVPRASSETGPVMAGCGSGRSDCQRGVARFQ